MFYLFLLFAIFPQTESLSSLETLVSENPGEAEKALLKVVSDKEKEAMASLLLCRLYTNQNDYKKALPYGEQASKLLPDNSDAQYYYAVAIRQKMTNNTMFAMGNTGKYKKLLDRAIELDKENIPAYEEQFGFFMNAPSIAGGSKEKAESLANELLEINREKGLAMLYRVYQNKKIYDKQLATADELLTMAPDNRQYLFFKGYALQNASKHQEAVEFFENAYKKDPNDLAALYQMARSRILGEFDLDRAVSILDEYIEKADERSQPSAAAAHWRAGNAYEKMNKLPEARKRYEASLELDPRFPESKQALKKLKKKMK